MCSYEIHEIVSHVSFIDAVCVANGDGNYFNTNECTGGYTCNGNFIVDPVTCTAGTYYNTVSGVCESTVPANCVGGKFDMFYLPLMIICP